MKSFDIEVEFKYLRKEHPYLVHKNYGEYDIIEGYIGFSTVILNEKIEDQYAIRLLIPKDYPKEMIVAFEIENRIKKDENEHINEDGTLCVGRPIEIARVLAPNYRLIDYVNKLLIGYLAQNSYFEKHKVWPFGEAEHGAMRIAKYYMEKYDLADIKAVYNFLNTLQESIEKQKKGYERCWCGCNKLYKNCKKQRKILKNRQKGYNYQKDIDTIKCILENTTNI